MSIVDMAMLLIIAVLAIFTSTQRKTSRKPYAALVTIGLLLSAMTLLFLRGNQGLWSLRDLFLHLMPKLPQ